MKTNHKLAAVLACLVAACLVAACGSSTSSSTTSASPSSGGSTAVASAGGGASTTRAKLVACLKQHGVTLPARPGGFRHFRPGGGGGFFGGGGGFFGGGGASGGGASGSGASGSGASGSGASGSGGFHANPKLLAAFKACGAANFPHRRFGFGNRRLVIDNFVKCVRQHGYNLPTPNFSGTGPVFPRSIESNAKFQAAAKACAKLLIRPGGPPPGQSTASATA